MTWVIILAAGMCALAAALRFGDNDQGIVRASHLRVIETPRFYPVVDAHMHIDPDARFYDLAVEVMDRSGVAVSVNLGGGSGGRLEKSLDLAAKYPGRFVTFCDARPTAKEWSAGDLGRRIARRIDESVVMGATGFGEIVKWGLYGKVRWDEERLDPVWEKLEELALPFNWHVADPSRYWRPAGPENCLEASGYQEGFPLKHELIMQQERVLERHPRLVVIASHANWLNDQMPHLVYRLEKYPNYHFDLSGVCDELGQAPREFYDLCVKYPGRILFGTDACYNRSAVKMYGRGAGAIADFHAFFMAHYLFLGTSQRMIPCAFKGAPGRHFVGYENGFARFANDGVALPRGVLEKIYFRNAERLMGARARGYKPAASYSTEVSPARPGRQ